MFDLSDKPAIPQTDDDATARLTDGYDPLISKNLVALYRLEREHRGATIAQAFEKALRDHLDAIKAARS